MKIVIKIGSAVLTDRNSKIKKDVILNITNQVCKLMKIGHSVLIITSGAIASCGNKAYPENLKASIGQPKLMSIYSKFFGVFKQEIAQFLYTHQDFKDKRREYVGKTLKEALKRGIVPIINANDAVTSEEIDALKEFSDNDILARDIASLVDADILFILIKEKGLMNYKTKKVISEISFNQANQYIKDNIFSGKRGGMRSKVRIAKQLWRSGVKVKLLPGSKKDIILRSFENKRIGTIFKP
ncbi:MAG: hypothetical protein Q8N28_01565 [bacterium]|nr:hypothetical protein [bacterium]